LDLWGKITLHENQITTHINVLINVFYEYRTMLNTVAAGGAGPELIVLTDVPYESFG
jgi:hypothetical protein